MPKLSPVLSRLLLLGATLLAACGPADGAGSRPEVRAQLEAGRDAAQAWLVAARTADTVSVEQAVALGYLERLRLGLGGPFRLIDFAVHDPRLADSIRVQLGWALLGRTAAGATYQVDAVVLDGAADAYGNAWPFRGATHLQLIQDAIRESPDPRAGELAVRLGYSLAAAEGSLGPNAPRIAARIAALVRDRELARSDAREVLDSARVTGTDALALVQRWRAERRLSSEAPFLAPLSGTLERQALEIAPRLAESLRDLALESRQKPRRGLRANVREPLLTRPAAERLLAVADSLRMPPLAPITVALGGYRSDLTGATPSPPERGALAGAGTEEALVARAALLGERSAFDAAPSLAMLWAAAGMRTLAQEEVWFPGYSAPTSRELEQRFGLTVRFDDDVPAEWRPYYRRMLQTAIEDLQRVLPALDLNGMRVRFDIRTQQEGTLALHDPRKRELILPPGSAAGTLAHEIAHDLDWQLALSRYRVRGDYASDRATRTARSRSSDPLALRLQELYAGTTLPAGTSERLAAHARRPAEVFARSIDWFVAVSLAGRGRMNGYLTSVQDELLTGYGTVRPPELSGTAGDALMGLLDVMAPVYPETRTWFLRNYGSGRDLRAYDLARRVLETDGDAANRNAPILPNRWQQGQRSQGGFARIADARDESLRSVEAWSCRAQNGAYDQALENARRRLVLEAAGARARGLARERVRLLGDGNAELRLARELYGVPFGGSPVSVEAEDYVQQLAAVTRQIAQPPAPPAHSGFRLSRGSVEQSCSILP